MRREVPDTVDIWSTSRGSSQWCRRDAFVLALGLIFAVALAAPAHADCARASVSVVGTAQKREGACAALEEVLAYFAAGGITVDLQLNIRFRPAVYVKLASATGHIGEFVHVSGTYDASTKQLDMVDANAARISECRPWGVLWDPAIGHSMLQHEIIHAVVAQMMGERYFKLPHAWHEALAYAIQIDLMELPLQQTVLSQYPGEEGLTSTMQINDIVYGFDPDAFAIAAYKTYRSAGRLTFLKKAVNFELDIIDLNELIP
jgi:Family of unknown function (DUF6639)